MIEEELLEYYLALDDKRRARQFADTARVAHFVGLSQRTIQLWIEIGLIRAVRIGRKYQVDLQSVKAHLRACQEAWDRSPSEIWPESGPISNADRRLKAGEGV